MAEKKVEWEKIKEAIKKIERNGGEVINRPKYPRQFSLPTQPGIGLLGAADCLINYGGFRQIDPDR